MFLTVGTVVELIFAENSSGESRWYVRDEVDSANTTVQHFCGV